VLKSLAPEYLLKSNHRQRRLRLKVRIKVGKNLLRDLRA
jgi:hypothetical protein